jgi:hypothetical protein
MRGPGFRKSRISNTLKSSSTNITFVLWQASQVVEVTEAGPSTELVDYFVEEYKSASRFLIGLLVIAELKKSGIEVGERGPVRALFKRLVDPHSPNQLTDEGMRRMNAYASGGYEYLAERRDARPYSGEEFLRDYVELINEAMGD